MQRNIECTLDRFNDQRFHLQIFHAPGNDEHPSHFGFQPFDNNGYFPVLSAIIRGFAINGILGDGTVAAV